MRSCPGFPSTHTAVDITLLEMVGRHFILLLRNPVSAFAISPSPALTCYTGCTFIGDPHQSNGVEVSQPLIFHWQLQTGLLLWGFCEFCVYFGWLVFFPIFSHFFFQHSLVELAGTLEPFFFSFSPLCLWKYLQNEVQENSMYNLAGRWSNIRP